jgi:hypothetical protein
MERTAVPIGQGHIFKKQVIRHIVASVDEHGNVRARCGTSFKGATMTWQEDRVCLKCRPLQKGWPPEDFTARWEIVIGHREAQVHMPGGLEGLRAYCLKALEASTGKAMGRAIVRFLGYDPPELILAERPDLDQKVRYASPAMEAKYDYSRKITKISPF